MSTKNEAISIGVAKSWKRKDVAVKRKTRRTVFAKKGTGKEVEYASLRKAFAALGLPDSKHIPFRIRLNEGTEEKGATHREVFEWQDAKYTFRVGNVVRPR